MSEYRTLQFQTLECGREFKEDIEDFIRLNRNSYYQPKLSEKQRIFYIRAGAHRDNYVGRQGDFLVTANEAVCKIYEIRPVRDKSVVIISNRRVKERAKLYIYTLLARNEVERMLNTQYFKSWIVDDDYKDILIFNFGDYEVRTGILRGLDAPFQQEITKEQLDEYRQLQADYSHKCFRCKRNLYIGEIIWANKTADEEWLKKLWESDDVEFYCCRCYSKEKGSED